VVDLKISEYVTLRYTVGFNWLVIVLQKDRSMEERKETGVRYS
jgi:hypothetical protein